MASPTHLKSLQAIEMAIRLGSLAAAGEQLGITAAAVGQRVKTLEDYLGIQLLRRGKLGIEPTEELMVAIPHLEEGMSALEAAATALDLQRASDIYIAAPSDFVDLWLAPLLPEFRATHPNVRFSVNGEGEAPSRIGQADCEILFTDPSARDCDVLFHDLVLPVCSPTNLKRLQGLDATTRLEGFPILHVDFYKEDPVGISWRHWLDQNSVRRSDWQRGMRFRSINAALDAVTADAGVALMGLSLISHQIDEKQLVLPYSPKTGLHTSHAFCADFRQRSTERRILQHFRDWLILKAAETKARLMDAERGQ